MKLQTLGHASILLTNNKNEPVLLTDPWLIGSCYWRSWWLQSYPGEELLKQLSTVKYCYITHEHPDHYHLPSIRKLGNKPAYISPKLPEESIPGYLQSMGLNARSLQPLRWYNIDEGINILSIPLYNDDSCLLIETPTAMIVNLNDSKPATAQLKRLRSFLDGFPERKVVVLSSYSPASIVNSFRKNSEYVSIKDKQAYIDYLNNLTETLQADFFMPFASQVIFYRPDSAWANAYKVTIEDIRKGWVSKTALMNPYTTIDLQTFQYASLATELYNHDAEPIREKVAEQIKNESGAELTAEDKTTLEKKLRFHRIFLWPLFPSGIGFITEKESLFFSTRKGRFIASEQQPSFAIRVPTQALKDAVTYGHFGDLGITMFTLVILNEKTNPKLIYVFFILLTLHDYKHTVNFHAFRKWLSSSLKTYKWKIPAIGSNVPGIA